MLSGMPICLDETLHRTQSLFEMAKEKLEDKTEKEETETFKASHGWWDKYSKRMGLGSVKLIGEAKSPDHEAAEAFPDILKEAIEEGGYTEDQIFNADEFGHWWKLPPTRTIKRKSRQTAGLKLQKSRSSVLLGGNASGDHKLKPFFIHKSLNPRCFKRVKDKSRLPVIWSANKKAWMTATLFEKWFTENFIPEVKAYCGRKKIPFKILLLLDNCTAHPDLSHIDPNVKVMFLPPNTTSLIQPMDQGLYGELCI